MPFYPDGVIDEVRDRNDIVGVVSSYVKLKQSGSNYFGLCPFHREKTPSFSVNADKQIFHCFGCGAGGNVISFIMRVENYGFMDAVKHLAERVHYTLPDETVFSSNAQESALRERLYDIHIKAARFFYDALTAGDGPGREASAYLENRKVSPRIIKKFGLGYAPGGVSLCDYLFSQGFSRADVQKSGLSVRDKSGGYIDKFRNRLMFPILDASGRVVAFGGRIIGPGEPKYLNSPDTPVFSKSKNLFAINFARKTKAAEIIIVEGYMDVLSLFQAGFTNAVASLGTAFNRDHCQNLSRYFRGKTAVLLFDSDEAGEKAALRAIPVVRQSGVTAKVLQLENAKDPDEFICKFGAESFAKALAGAKSLTAFQLGVLKKNYDISDTEQKILFVNEAAAVLAALDNSIERDAHMSDVSAETGISEKALKTEVDKRLNTAGEAFFAGFNPQNIRKPVHTYEIPTGTAKACRSVLYWLSAHEGLYKSLKAAVKADEFPLPVHEKLYDEIIKIRDTGKHVIPAEFVGRFDPVEQNEAAAVFAEVLPFADEGELAAALNQQIKVIKTADILNKINNSKAGRDVETLQKLGKILNNLPNSYI